MLRSRLFLLAFAATSALAVLGTACGGGDGVAADGPDAAVTTPPLNPCADGFSDQERGFCAETATADACAAGTRPRVGEAACVPVGFTSACPTGTLRDPSGWGCIDVPAPAACTGATRLALATNTCVPVGDCSAAFPPAGALLVDGTYDAGTLDATHFKTITDAVKAAKAGATIAVAAGTYVEGVTLSKAVTLVGRCPAQVTMKSPAGEVRGIVTSLGATVAVRGITFDGFAGGIMVYGGAEATIEDVIVTGSNRVGIEVDQSKATIRRVKLVDPVQDAARGRAWGISAGAVSEVLAEDVTITGGTDGLFVATEGTRVTVRGAMISGQRPPSPASSNRSRGASSVDGAVLTIEKSVLRDIVADGALVADNGTVEASEIVIHTVRVDGDAARGHGVAALAKGRLKLKSSTVLDAESLGIAAKDAGSTIELVDTVVRGPAKSGAVPNALAQVSSERAGIGLQISVGATGTVENSAIVDSWAYGAYADSGSTLTVKGSLIDNTRPVVKDIGAPSSIGVGVTSNASTVTLDDVAVTRSTLGGITAGKAGKITGTRVLVRDVVAGKPSTTGGAVQAGSGGIIELDGSVLTRISSIGVIAYGGASRVALRRSSVHGVIGAGGEAYGHGVMVIAKAEVSLQATSVFDNAVIGLAVSTGRAIVESSVFARNAIGVQAQDGSFLVESADLADLGDGEVRVSPDSKFLDNAVRVGSATVPLPTPVLP